MAAIRERWFADDWEFTDGDIMDVEYRDGQMGSPPVRGANAKVANRTGEVWRPKLHDPGTFTLQLWLGTYQIEAQRLWDQLLRAVVQPHRLITWHRITAEGESRYCEGEVTGALQPTFVGQSSYRASIDVTVPKGYWRGDTLLSVSSPLTGDPMSRDIDLSVFSGSTAALEELSVAFTGGLTGPQLIDTTDRGRGETLSYVDPLPPGGTLTLGCGDWSDTEDGDWTGFTYNAAAVNHSGDRFWTLAATPPGVTHTAQLVTTAPIPAGAGVTISGYKSYLC